METLKIPVRDPNEQGDTACVVKVNRKAMALIKGLCTETNRTQQDIASRLIEWAYEHVEVIDNGNES